MNKKVENVYRKEIKYPISLLDFALMRKRLECYVQPDKHSGEYGYQVRSVYFDSNRDKDLFDTLDGNMDKRKIRIRIYPPNRDNINLEYKCKSGTDGVKRSIKISREDAKNMLSGNYTFLMGLQDPLAHELYARMTLEGYHPRVIVEYNRLAYTYPVSNTRVTFDSSVSASYVVDSFFDENSGMIPIMQPDMGVLEVKYDNFLVGILKEVVESSVNSMSQANSKYGQSRFLF